MRKRCIETRQQTKNLEVLRQFQIGLGYFLWDLENISQEFEHKKLLARHYLKLTKTNLQTLGLDDLTDLHQDFRLDHQAISQALEPMENAQTWMYYFFLHLPHEI